MDMETTVRDFFHRYEKLFNQGLTSKPDVKGIRDSFAKTFMEAGPKSVYAAKNGWKFRFFIPRAYAFYRKIGTQSIEIRAVEVTPLDGMHTLARVSWRSTYKRRSDGEIVVIDFDVFYLLRIEDGKPKIFAFIAGDEQGELKRRGLV
jgi:hypothetical protein